jgi:hypothetical protein
VGGFLPKFIQDSQLSAWQERTNRGVRRWRVKRWRHGFIFPRCAFLILIACLDMKPYQAVWALVSICAWLRPPESV